MVPGADWDSIAAKLREEYAEDIVQEMLLKLWSAKAEIKDPIRYAKSCLRDIHAQRGRDEARRERWLPITQDPAIPATALDRAIARQELARTPKALIADELGLQPLTSLQRHRARRKHVHFR